jgi:hypothetical protein
MNELINPNKLEAKHKRWNDPRFAGGKVYLPVLSGAGYANRCRHIFSRATEAQEHAEQIRQYLILRYNREIERAALEALAPEAA